MERENRYLVFKMSDVENYLDVGDMFDLEKVSDFISACRTMDDKPPLKCVVVEDDWPEYEIVWGMIEDREEGIA